MFASMLRPLSEPSGRTSRCRIGRRPLSPNISIRIPQAESAFWLGVTLCVTYVRHCAFARAALHIHQLGSVHGQQTSNHAVSLTFEQIEFSTSISFASSHPITTITAHMHQSLSMKRR